MASLQLTPPKLAELIVLIDDGTISGKIAKQLLPDLFEVRPGGLVHDVQWQRAIHVDVALRTMALPRAVWTWPKQHHACRSG